MNFNSKVFFILFLDTLSNSSSPLRQFADERRRQSACSTLSTPNLQAVPPSNTGSIQVYDQLAQQQRPHQSSTTQLSKIEEKIQGRGMCRSSASYGIQQMLQEQVGVDKLNEVGPWEWVILPHVL